MRTNNLIQAYVNGQPTNRYNSEKAVKNFDVHKELSNRTFIKPLPSNGELVRPTLFEMPAEVAKGLKYDWNSFRHAVTGKANDHELGRLNDVGMKLGGLAIASYLFTRKQTPMTKLFEFVGLTTFFGAMDLWPKLFLQLPAWLVHGVNVRQKYKDNYGRKKMFYSDPQFIPWDLYSDKEINKIGNRLHVPKDIPNRRDFIQEKMRKIALQNNTMWMLTSGFATPLMSALICNRLEAPIARYLHQQKDKKAESLLTNFTQEVEKADFSASQKALSKILEDNNGKTLTPEVFDSIAKTLTKGQDPRLAKAIVADLRAKMPMENVFDVSAESLENVRKSIFENFKNVGLSEHDLNTLVPTSEEMLRVFSENNLTGTNFKDFSAHSRVVQSMLDEKINLLAKFSDENSSVVKRLKFMMNKFVHQAKKGDASPLESSFKTQPSAILTDDATTMIKQISSALNSFKAKSDVLNKYSYIKVAQAQETILADVWNETSEGFLKALKMTPDEISKSRLDGEIAGEVLRNKIETIVADKKECGEFLSSIEKLLAKMYSSVEKLENPDNPYKTLVDSSFEECAQTMKEQGFKRSKEALVGFDDSARTSLKGIYLSHVADRLTGVKSSFYRLLQTVDTYYKIAHLEGVDSILNSEVPRVVKEEMVELAKSTLIDGHTSDFAEKLYQRRQPLYGVLGKETDCSQIEVNAGKVNNRYYGKKLSSELVPQPNDREYFNSVMKLMFGGDVHPDISSKISSSPFFADFVAYRADILKKLGGDFNFAFPNVLLDGQRTFASSNEKFNRLGCSANELLQKLANNRYNSKSWFSTFGKLGIAVAGITLLSQFFIGHMKKPQSIEEVK